MTRLELTEKIQVFMDELEVLRIQYKENPVPDGDYQEFNRRRTEYEAVEMEMKNLQMQYSLLIQLEALQQQQQVNTPTE